MTDDTALLDANVLYSAQMRDILLQLAVTSLFRARWTADIHREWMEALLENSPDIKRDNLEKTRGKMDKFVPDALITGYEGLIDELSLPDPNDRHVLAAAIRGECNVIITQNLKHFPKEDVAPHGIEVLCPDDFLSDLLHLFPKKVCASVRNVLKRLKNPPYTPEQYLTNLKKNKLSKFASNLEQCPQFIANPTP